MTALKMVPWGDVIENAPALVNGAKRLFTSSRTAPLAETEAPPPPSTSKVDAAQLLVLLDQSQTRINMLEAEQQETAALIKSLAEQQQKVVAAIEVLSKRSTFLIGFCVVLTIACAALGAALLYR